MTPGIATFFATACCSGLLLGSVLLMVGTVINQWRGR